MKKENNNRKFPGERASRFRPDNAKFRREEAAKRQADYDKLSIKEKLAKLDAKLGPGQGAERQRAKLMAQLEKASQPKPVETPQQQTSETEPQPDKKHMKAKDRREHERK